MLSAVENFGSVAVPSAGMSFAHHHLNSNGGSYVMTSSSGSTSTSLTSHAPHTPTTPTQLTMPPNLGHLQHQHMRFFMTPSLPSPPLSSPSSIASCGGGGGGPVNMSYMGKSPLQYVGLPNSYSPKSIAINSTTTLSPPSENSNSRSSLTEFTKPPPKLQLSQRSSYSDGNPNFTQAGPMNLATSQTAAATTSSTSSASSSSSLDVENDGSLSPINIPSQQQQQQQLQHAQDNAKALDAIMYNASLKNSENASSIASLAAAYQYNYSQLYANSAGLYVPSVLSSQNPQRFLSAIPSVATAAPPTAAAYLKAIQNAMAAGMFQQSTGSMLTANSTNTSTKLSSAGTYLNGKINANMPTDTDADNFKVPSGKEGSLKHRILTRPSSGEMDGNRSSVMRTHNSTSNFRKGSCIKLSNGVIRRVEDMRTEDFIQCAERSACHQLAESTVVKINTKSPNTVVITFSYDKNRAKVDIEVDIEHPFFVYGQGWASCHPENSLNTFGLKCQRLQVGDICISLTQRETPAPIYASAATAAPSLNNGMYAATKQQTNLAEDIRTAAAATNQKDIAMTPVQFGHNIPMHLIASQMNSAAHLPYSEMVDMVNAAYGSAANNSFMLPPSKQVLNSFYAAPSSNMPLLLPQQQTHQQHQQQQQQSHSNESLPCQGSTQLQHHQQQQQHSMDNDQPVDASMSRKRRWSAPENIEEEAAENQPLPLHLSAAAAGQSQTNAAYKTLKTAETNGKNFSREKEK